MPFTRKSPQRYYIFFIYARNLQKNQSNYTNIRLKMLFFYRMGLKNLMRLHRKNHQLFANMQKK